MLYACHKKMKRAQKYLNVVDYSWCQVFYSMCKLVHNLYSELQQSEHIPRSGLTDVVH